MRRRGDGSWCREKGRKQNEEKEERKATHLIIRQRRHKSNSRNHQHYRINQRRWPHRQPGCPCALLRLAMRETRADAPDCEGVDEEGGGGPDATEDLREAEEDVRGRKGKRMGRRKRRKREDARESRSCRGCS